MKMNTTTTTRRETSVGRAVSCLHRRLRMVAALIVTAVGMLMPQGAWALDTVILEGKTFYVLRNSDDWNAFCDKTKSKGNVNAIMAADISVTQACYYFRGLFDGNGHTLNANISDYNTGVFIYSGNSTIKNLHVTGNINNKYNTDNTAGLVSDFDDETETITISDCWVSATVKGGVVSGFINRAFDVEPTITNCLFDGKLISVNKRHGAVFVGVVSWSTNVYVTNCLEKGTYEGLSGLGFSCDYSIPFSARNGSNNWAYTKGIANDLDTLMNKSEMAMKLGGDNWKVLDKQVVPIRACPLGDVNFQTYDLVPGTANDELGMLKIPFSSDQAVTWINGTYTDENGATKTIDGIAFKKNTYAGFIKVPAAEQHKNMKLNIVLANGFTILDYEVQTTDKMMHKVQNLTTSVLKFSTGKLLTDAGAVELKWTVSNPAYKDVVEGDQFLVMRSFTDNTADMQNIGSVVFDNKTTNYTFKDSTLVSALTEEQLKGGSVTARYIVIRASAKELWGLSNNVTSATQSQALNNLHLLKVNTDYKAEWKDQTARTISVNWSYGNEAGAVWDSRAQMKLVLSSVNRNNEPVDTTTYVLTTDEMKACKKELTLNRSCVYYNLEFVTELGSTVVHYKTPDQLKDKIIAISSAADWATFVNMVKEAQGEYNVNAWLMADISITTPVGESAAPYRGVFEGNGHTLTCNINKNEQYVAPFRFVGNATIRNLHTAGSVTTNNKFAAGLVSRVSDNYQLLIEGCHVSVDVSSSINGDATNGGIVAIGNNGSTITIRNCKFDGRMRGANCYANGGIVGYTTGQVVIENTLFDPAEISTKMDDCQTWSRKGGSGRLTTTNCHCTREYDKTKLQVASIRISSSSEEDFYVLRNAEDWTKFGQMVKEAKGNTYIRAIMAADFTVNTMVATSEEEAFYGLFYGNGHTLTVNIDNGTESYTAPFGWVKIATFISLHVAGKVKGGMHSSGLVGTVVNDGKIDINRTRVSVDITTTGTHLGGFIGHAGETTSSGIYESLFDGSLTAPAGTGEYGGAFVGWCQEHGLYNRPAVSYCYEKGTYNNIAHAGFSYVLVSGTLFDNGIHPYSTYGCGTCHGDNWDEAAYYNLTEPQRVVELLNRNNGWEVVDGEAVPVMNVYDVPAPPSSLTDKEILAKLGDGWTTDASGSPVPKTTVSQPIYDDDDVPSGQFYYENLGHIAKESLETETRPTSVLLTWENETDEPVDYYEIHRYDKQEEKWDTIATQLTDMQYEDKRTSPVHQYIYKVRGVTSCEGLTYDETAEVEGMCYQTASVEGHLCFLDGTGIPGKKVFISVGNEELADSTDESGRFKIENIPYKDGQETAYGLSVVGINGLDPVLVTFGTEPGDNVVTGQRIEVGESVKMSGSVTYEGTSIPAQGVSFLVDGYKVQTAAGTVTTDHEGNFSFRALKGPHSIQAVKDGHDFWRDGFYHAKDNDPDTLKKYDFQTDQAGMLFYDQTRVKLIGRVVGGNTQGELPLGSALSNNNLGDNLQMVFVLEGDNASRLVFDNQDRSKNTRDEVFLHEAANKVDGKHQYQTSVHTTLNRMVVSPDRYTGEYEVLLPPVKWKIQQITAKGYATLFQDGQVGDVIDLTDSIVMHHDTIKGKWNTVGDRKELTTVVEEYQAKYSRIYHSPVQIEYKQQGFGKFDFFGDQYYSFKNLAGSKQKLAMAYGVRKQDWTKGKKDSLETRYTFGYPVFSIDKKYPLWISATEKYYYNNNMASDTIDVVQLPGGVVTIHNGMVSQLHRDTVQLDSLGQANYVMEIAQKPYLLTGDDALQTMTMTLLRDGTHYEATPLKGYVFQIQQATGTQDILSVSQPLLLDVLRDPPGGSSHATLSKGSTVKRAYTMDLQWKAGLTIGMNVGVALKTSTGLVAAPFGIGTYVSSSIDLAVGAESSINLAFSGSGERAFEYTMTTTQDISTSSDPKLVGADGDLYIGTVQNIEVKPATAIRAIPDSTFQQSGGMLESGRMIEIASGVDHNGYPLHLVREEVVTYGATLNSNFVHSQQYIINQLIPELTEQCLSLLFIGSKDEAQAQANAKKEPVYWSKVGRENEKFGVNYEMICPTNVSGTFKDEVKQYQESIKAWIEMIARNEKAKLDATNLVANYDVDGGTTINYSESFQSDYSVMNSFVSPFTPITDGYFDNGLANAAALVGTLAANLIGLSNGTKASVEFKGMGANIEVSFSPAASFNVTPKHTESKSFSRTESFSISMDKKNHLDFDVYRAMSVSETLPATSSSDLFVSQDFWKQVNYDKNYLNREFKTSDFSYPTSFVYRTRGGATCRPWEDERKTMFNRAGTVLDVRTKKIENPQIKMDKQSVSGVPYGEPARFKLYLTNESEQPEAAYIYFDLYQADMSNPDGARLMIDGMPLTGTARTIEVRPGIVTEKTLEVYAGEKFDYEGLRIGIISQNDIDCYAEVAFDVHYLQTAGDIAILTPGDKWVLNCDAPTEEGKGWYLPVTIGGFDKNQHNFDHIEFQYKESNRGDDYWTNLCGYYADSTLYRAASGTKEMIPKNGNIMTRFFGEGEEMEKAYDLRAVLFCRNGNAFLTNESKVLSGIKDTRRPQLFGTPEPKSGILGAGDNIVFDFSEDIEYNYLQKITNFEVVGETNETAIQEAPSLQFGGNGIAQTQATRNFADKNVTIEVMVKPESTGQEMPLFSHGSEGKHLQLWLTKEHHLMAILENGDRPHIVESEKPIGDTGFQRVAMVLDNENQRLTLYGDVQMAQMDSVTYSGYGPLTFGYASSINSDEPFYYKGRMLQGRLWYRAMDLTTLNRYGGKLLTGYELGLADYYPMNDGTGDYAQDLAQGAHLTLDGASWAQPNGMSLKLDSTKTHQNSQFKGLQLKTDLFQRDDEQDYTLMFWFKTAEENGTLLANGSGKDSDEGAKSKFFIGFEDHTLLYRTNGREFALGDNLCNDSWHHYAMTVNRALNVATIYIDNVAKAQLTTDSLGGMLGTRFYLGNTVWQEKGIPDVLQGNALTGYIDGLALFEQALPATLIKRYSTKSPGGEEQGLKVYMPFDHQEEQKSGTLALMPYALSNVVKRDNDGNDLGKRDSVFVDSIDEILSMIDETVGAPVQAYEELRKLDFSYVGRNNQLLVNIKEQDARINKKNIYVTLRDIPDKNGNYMKSPVTETFYVNRNPLTWLALGNHRRLTIPAGQEWTVTGVILNNGGKAHTYTIENMPRWMTVDKTSDIVQPQGEDEVQFTISKDLEPGSYDQIVYLTDEDGMSDPLYLDLTVEGEEPDWAVDPSLKRYSMNVVAQVFVNNDLVTDKRDKVAVFDQEVGGRCMGVNNIEYDATTGQSMLYMTVYDSTTVANRLFFRLWHYATGKTMQLSTSEIIDFGNRSIVGTVDTPVLMFADNLYQQTIDLAQGWNWISFNVYDRAYERLSNVLSRFPWQEGDILTEDSEGLTLVYKKGQWISTTGSNIKDLKLSQKVGYNVLVQNDREIELWGTSYRTIADRTVTVKPGWSTIGYTPLVNLPIATALTDYFDKAKTGDVVKSQHEFAMFTSDGKGSGKWQGTLKYMKPGEGYMIHRQKTDTVTFTYPFYEPGQTYIETTVAHAPQHTGSPFPTTMTMVAEVVGMELEEDDRLVAYTNGEEVGVAPLSFPEGNTIAPVPESSLFFLSIGGNEASSGAVGGATLSFAIERDGEIIATTGEVMKYEANGIYGSPDEPTQISFVKAELPQTGWYTVEGVKLPKAPTRSGVYIHNGKKQVVK